MGNTNLREGGLAEGGTESPRTAQTPRQRKKKPKTFDDDEWMEAAFSASKDLHSARNGSRIRIREDQERATQLRRSSSDRGIIQPDKDGIRRSVNGEGASKTESLSRRRALNRNLGINYSQPPLSARGRPPSYTPPQTRDRASSMEEGATKQLKSKSAVLSGSTTSSPDKATSGLASSSVNKKPKELPTSTPTTSPVSTPRDSPRSVRSPRLAQAGSGMSKLWSHSVQHLTKGFKNAQEPDQEGPESHSNSSGESSNQVPVKKTSIRGTRTVRVSPRTPRRTNSTEGDGICASPRKAKDEEEEQELPASPRRMEEQEEIRRKPKKSRSKDDLREQLAGDKKSPRAKKKTASVDKDEEVRPSTPKRSKSKKKVLEEEVEETEERDPRRPGSSRSKEDGEKEKEPQQRKRRSRKKKLDADSPRDSPRTARGREKEKEKGEKENEKEEDVKQEVAENKESHSRASRRGTILFYQMMSSGAATLGQQNEGTEEL